MLRKEALAFSAVVVVLVFSGLVISQNEGSVSLFIVTNDFAINITHPMNQTYNFARNVVYNLSFNVTASAPVDSWWYKLEEPTRVRGGGAFILGGNLIVDNQSFTPNSSVVGVRFGNVLTVYANDSAERFAQDSETFSVNVGNLVPTIGILSNYYACEGTSLSPGTLSQSFDADDEDENDLEFDIDGNAGACSYIFVFENPTSLNIIPYHTDAQSSIYTQNLYPLPSQLSCIVDVSVAEKDGVPTNLVASSSVNITVIEINSPPNIINPIGVQTIVWGQGDNSTFVYDFNATDDENFNENGGLLNFNVSFNPSANLFSITSDGKIDYTASNSEVGNYNVRICVTDQGLPPNRIHPLLQTQCGQNGLNQSNCNTFQLTVTDENRAPEIVNRYPLDENFSAVGLSGIYFNVSERDPDGTIPDTYWYVDNELKEYDNMSLNDNFTYLFPCDVGGIHFVKVETTDGLLNDSFVWNISVESVGCPVAPAGSGGGGGGGGGGAPPACVPRWGCYDWSTCRNLDEGLRAGEIEGETYREIAADCQTEGHVGDFCGYQNRECFDTLSCNRNIGKPDGIQSCYFTENPSCSDGIKNCHDGACEFLVDCGGPCGACATCSDNLKNQGEGGVDCGGPCPQICPVEQPLIEVPKISIYWKLGIGAALLIIIGIWIKIYLVWKKTRQGY